MYVFLDGILQVKGKAYTVSGPNITFASPIKKEHNVDIRYLYGRDVGQVLNIYDFAPDTYFAQGTLSFTTSTPILDNLLAYGWMGDAIGTPIHCWQQRANGTYNVIGELKNPIKTGNNVTFELKCQNPVIESGLDFTFTVKGYYDRTYVIADGDISNQTLTFKKDEANRKLLKDDNGQWSGTFYGKTYKAPFVYLANNDKIRVEGEEGFRNIKRLPTEATSKDGRSGEATTDDIFGTVSIETYTGITRGEGLSVVATIENGSVISLTWNQRSYDPLTQPTAYQYYTPPVLKFESLDGNGGGARANVLVSKGQVISVDLIDGGSGYTTTPKVITTRRFDILKERDIGVSLINIGINPYVESGGLTATSVISEIDESGLSAITGISSVQVEVAGDAEIVIEREFDLKEVEVFSIGGALDPKRDYIEFFSTEETSADDVKVIDVYAGGTVVSAELQDIITTNSISTVSKAITTTVQVEIPNNAISNTNYFENAAYLNVDLEIGDSIVYIPDTTKFAPNGKLMIGNELVFYNRKINDRFLQVIRGYDNTTEQFWAAGAYLRQIEDIAVVSAAVASIQSESDVSMVSASSTAGGFERRVQRQISPASVMSVTREATEVVITPPPGGVVDKYQETAFLTNPIAQRVGSGVFLVSAADKYYVTQRNGNEQLVRNTLFTTDSGYIGNYAITNVGYTIGHFDGIFDDGMGVSGMTIEEVSRFFGGLTLDDFTKRRKSQYTSAGDKFNLAPPSIQQPVTTTTTVGTIPTSIAALNTAYFDNAGYLFTSSGSVIQYASKTANTFDGCTLIRGSNSISNGDELIPFAIT
jgi:hypothetical protein